MDFIKTLFSKLYNPKINEEQDGFPNIPSQPSNTPDETSSCCTEEYKLLPNAEFVNNFSFGDSDNAIEDTFLHLTQSLDDILNNSNNIDRDETIIKNDIDRAAEKENSLDSARNLNNSEFNYNINNISIEETMFNDEINALIETVSFDAMQNLDITEPTESTSIDLGVTTVIDDKNNAIDNVLQHFVKRENAETNNIDKFNIEEFDHKTNITIDKVLLDLDKFELISYKYEENEVTTLMDVKEPINIDNVTYSNELIDLNDIVINTYDAIINTVDKEEVNEYDLGYELQDILTMINEKNDTNETVKMDINDIEPLSDNKVDLQKNIQSEILDMHPPEVSKDIVNKIDTIAISSNEALQLNTINNTDLTENTVINETARIDNNETSKLSANKQDSHNNTQCYNTKQSDTIQTPSPEITKDCDNIIDTISISSSEDLQFKSNINNIDTISISSNEDLPINKSYNTHILKDSHTSSATQNTIKDTKQVRDVNVPVKEIITDYSDSDSECSYHSSDFEFITEKEARKDGFIINFNESKHLHKNLYIQVPSRANSFNDVTPGPSNHLFLDNYRTDHVIPEGDDFFNLFQGIYTPDLSNTYMFENKSVHISKSMNVEFEGIGFDMRILSKKIEHNISEEEYKEEADQSVNRILEMYPGENRPKRRRRY